MTMAAIMISEAETVGKLSIIERPFANRGLERRANGHTRSRRKAQWNTPPDRVH
jgi:hypothetical protein